LPKIFDRKFTSELLNQPISISVEVVGAEAVDLMQNVFAPDTARPDTPSPDTIPGKLAPLAIGLRRPDDAAEDAAASAAGANTSRSGELPTVQDKPGGDKSISVAVWRDAHRTIYSRRRS